MRSDEHVTNEPFRLYIERKKKLRIRRRDKKNKASGQGRLMIHYNVNSTTTLLPDSAKKNKRSKYLLN